MLFQLLGLTVASQGVGIGGGITVSSGGIFSQDGISVNAGGIAVTGGVSVLSNGLFITVCLNFEWFLYIIFFIFMVIFHIF